MKFISIDTVLIKMYSEITLSVKSLKSNFPRGQKWQNVLYSEDILLKVKISMQVKDLVIHTSSRNLKQIPFSLKQLLMPILNDNFFNCRGCWENTHITAHIFSLDTLSPNWGWIPVVCICLEQEEWNQMGDFNEKCLMKHNGCVTCASFGVSWTLLI